MTRKWLLPPSGLQFFKDTLTSAIVILLLAACSAYGGEDVTTPTATSAPPAETLTDGVVPTPIVAAPPASEPTPGPEATSRPVATPIDPGFDPAHPYRFCEATNCVDFLSPNPITITLSFAEASITVSPVLHNPDVSFDESLPVCSANLLITNANDGESEGPVWHKTVLYAHSGNCRGDWHPSEYLRDYLEGGYLTPNATQREERLEALRGQTMIFDQGSGPVTFEIVDIAYLDQDRVEEEYIPDPGRLDRFFASGVQEDIHEAFWVFCGSVGLTRPTDPFATRYILRLQVVNPTD